MILLDDKKTASEFGKFIRKRRKELDLYQKDVAKRLGVTQAYMCLVERGNREVTLAMAINICRALDCNINDFIYYVSLKKPKIKKKSTQG